MGHTPLTPWRSSKGGFTIYYLTSIALLVFFVVFFSLFVTNNYPTFSFDNFLSLLSWLYHFPIFATDNYPTSLSNNFFFLAFLVISFSLV
jgi:hypothetical protein